MTPDAQLVEMTMSLLGTVRQIAKQQQRRYSQVAIIACDDTTSIGDAVEREAVEMARRGYLSSLCHVLAGMAHPEADVSMEDISRVLFRAREDLHLIGTTLNQARP